MTVIEASGGRVARLPYGLVRFPGRFRQLLRSERFGVVHSHVYYQSGNILRLAARWRAALRCPKSAMAASITPQATACTPNPRQNASPRASNSRPPATLNADPSRSRRARRS